MCSWMLDNRNDVPAHHKFGVNIAGLAGRESPLVCTLITITELIRYIKRLSKNSGETH